MTSKFVLVHSKQGVKEAKAQTAADKRQFVPAALELNALEFALTDEPKQKRPGPGLAPKTVGIWSLDAWLGSLSQLIEGLNQAQQAFIFYEVLSPVPSGLISRPERVQPWLKAALAKRPPKKIRETLNLAKKTISDNLIANDFFPLAESVRKNLGLDYIIGITPSMVAGKEADGTYYTDHFSSYEGRTILASSYELDKFSHESGMTFDAFLAVIVITELLVAVSPKLEYHDDTGCMFDYNDERKGLIRDVNLAFIEERCMNKIAPKYREAAKSFVEFIRSIREPKR